MNTKLPPSISSTLMVMLISALLLAFPLMTKAAWFDHLPYTVTQPDGTVIECFVSGDEYFNRLHDANGFTIIAGEDGYYYYGELQAEQVVAGPHRVDAVDPASVGIQPNIVIPKSAYLERREAFWQNADRSVRAPHTGIINNLVVYIRFSDQSEFTVPRYVYDNRFNNPDEISMKNYFYEVSYEQLVIESHHFPESDMSMNLSYQDQYPRNYYEPYHPVNNPDGYTNDTQRRLREHTLLMNAVIAIEDEVPVDLDIDADNDGYVDNVCFIIRGNSGAWADLLWAHRWVLYSFDVFIHGKQVYDYTFQPENQNNTYTLAHEMFHVLGAPDLYHYSSTGLTPVGPWDLMHSGFVHMGAHMKWKYAGQQWITDIPEIVVGGNYTLNPITAEENNAYRIASPNSSTEYFVVEYRKREGFYESELPGDGLLVYRIDPSAGNGNASGPPDEVYLYRPNGTPGNNGNISSAHFSQNVNRTAINDLTNPSSFLQNGSPGGLNIFNISEVGETISFDILVGTEVQADFSADATTVVAGESVQFYDESTNLPDSWEWEFPGGEPASSTEQNPQVMYAENGIYQVSLTAANHLGDGSTVKENFIIVGTPEMQVQPSAFDLTMETDHTAEETIHISNTGDTWLRYGISWTLEEPRSAYAGNREAGDILGVYPDFPANCSGITWADETFYVITFDGELYTFDTAQSQIMETYTIHNNAISMAYDGAHLWIGTPQGIFHAYELNGEPTGQTIEMPTQAIHTLAWDGNHFISNKPMQTDPLFYRFDQQGEIVETTASNLSGKRISQLLWVPFHNHAQLWANSESKIMQLSDEQGIYLPVSEMASPSVLSYALAHDGTDLWWADPAGTLYRIDDGLMEWFFIDWNDALLEAGNEVEIPMLFNTKGLEAGTYMASILLQSNDYDLPEIEIPVSLEVTIPTSLDEQEGQAAITLYSIHDQLIVRNTANQLKKLEVFDITGRLVKAIENITSDPVYVSGLKGSNIYLVRITTADQVFVRKVVL